MADLAAIFKAYDVRGLVNEQLDESIARRIGTAFAAEVIDGSTDPAVVIGYDMRSSSPGLATAFADGVRDTGTNVVMIGLASTDQLYFASGRLGLAGAMFTASHNPAEYNGIKFCRAGAVAIAADSGLSTIRDRVAAGARALPQPQPRRGRVEYRDMLTLYAAHLLDIVRVTGRRLTVVVDAANGMAGHTVPSVFGALDVELVPLYFELDGRFPNHEANPLDPENLRDLQTAVVRHQADVGLAFDGDADRCFVVDERGQSVSPSAMTSLIAVRELKKEPGARVVYNLISSRAVPEIIAQHGGTPLRSRVGHSFIKATMAREDAVFGGEHSGHYYFRDFWYADSGLLAALHLLATLAADNRPTSAVLAEFAPYAWSGELNFHIPDVETVIALVESEYIGKPDIGIDHLDGLTVSTSDWWFNIRPSNTEPLLRINVEADNSARMNSILGEVLSLLSRRM